MNSNNCHKVTDQTFAAEICQRCTFDEKMEIPYWSYGVSNECNLNKIKFHEHFSWDSPLGMVNNGYYFFTLLFCHCHFLLLTSSKLAGLTNLSFSL